MLNASIHAQPCVSRLQVTSLYAPEIFFLLHLPSAFLYTEYIKSHILFLYSIYDLASTYQGSNATSPN